MHLSQEEAACQGKDPNLPVLIKGAGRSGGFCASIVLQMTMWHGGALTHLLVSIAESRVSRPGTILGRHRLSVYG
jgi:hypothetical protein